MNQSRVLPPLLALRAFESAARHLSFSRAADELCVTQSAISRHIKSLEDILQKQLFLRRGRAVMLSPEGQQFFNKIVVGFSLIEEATKELVGNRDEKVLRLSVLPTLGMRWLAPRLHLFSQRHPSIEIHLIASIEPANFASGDVDIAIRVGQMAAHDKAGRARDDGPLATIDLEMLESSDGLVGEELFDDVLVVVYNPRLINPPATPEDLKHHVLISTMTRAKAWEDWFRIGGLEPVAADRNIGFGHFFMSLQAALEGEGIAILPQILIEQELASGQLKALFHKARSAGQYYAVYRQREMETRKVRFFRSWIREVARQYRDNPGSIGRWSE